MPLSKSFDKTVEFGMGLGKATDGLGSRVVGTHRLGIGPVAYGPQKVCHASDPFRMLLK